MITVCSFDGRHTFAADRDVVIGRDVRADVRIPHPRVSRSHALLRCLDGGWVVVDDGSSHGIFVGGQRVQSVNVRDGLSVHLADADGPRLTFELGTAEVPDDKPTTQLKRRAAQPETVTIGRAADNDIVVPDVLASRHHATLVTGDHGVQLRNTGTTATYVNGQPAKDTTLSETDVVTIGNVDFVFTDGGLVPQTRPAAKIGGLEVHGVSLTGDGDAVLLDRISLTARPGTLTALIGPSGAGKSTLAKVIVGAAQSSSGSVTFDALPLSAPALRSRIGLVPQDDVVHGKLTVAQALGFAAELRMPADASRDDRDRAIASVLAELELTTHADTRIDRLSGGQRKRVSVAMELLTGPSLLVLDEPTTGLDPALDRAVMAMLRNLADAGRVIVVVTHSLTFLDDCDQVLLLAPGGKTAFCGPPDDLEAAMGATDWADIFSTVIADPDGVQRRFLQANAAHSTQRITRPDAAQTTMAQPRRGNVFRQTSTLVRRQLRLLAADRGYLALLAALPFIVGLLPLTVIGDAGFGHPPADGSAPFEPRHVIALTSFAAILIGITLTVRDLIGERAIFRREQAAGLSASAYLLAKLLVFGAIAALQSAVLVLVVTLPVVGKPAPTQAAALGVPWLELFVGVAATCVTAAVLGLALSAFARTNEQVIVLLAIALMTQLVLAGGFIPVTDRPLFETIAWIMPGRWGFAATASTADLTNLVAGIAKDERWAHSASTWLFNMAMLGVLAVVFAALTRWRMRR